MKRGRRSLYTDTSCPCGRARPVARGLCWPCYQWMRRHACAVACSHRNGPRAEHVWVKQHGTVRCRVCGAAGAGDPPRVRVTIKGLA